jgi:hypothetical protein
MFLKNIDIFRYAGTYVNILKGENYQENDFSFVNIFDRIVAF